jgi:hypothetical protein
VLQAQVQSHDGQNNSALNAGGLGSVGDQRLVMLCDVCKSDN